MVQCSVLRPASQCDALNLARPFGVCVRTASGPGSPSGQPAWGGGCDRIIKFRRILRIPSLPLRVLTRVLTHSLQGRDRSRETNFRRVATTEWFLSIVARL